MRTWKLGLGVLIVLVIVIWDIGLPGNQKLPTRTASPSTRSSPTASASSQSQIPGVIQPQGKPEFAATFTGSNLDTSVWGTCYPWLSGRGCKNFGNREENEWYLPSQVRVSGGLLHLVAQRKITQGTTSSGTPKLYYCRSGMITSYPGFRFKYGYVQIIAGIPSSPGLWPALWLDPASLGWPPEMDMIESWGNGVHAGSFFHPLPKGSNSDRGVISPASQATGWHVFALSWTATQMTWLMDGKVTLTVRNKVPHQKMYIIANLASYKPVGANNKCDGQLLIRSVEVWKA